MQNKELNRMAFCGIPFTSRIYYVMALWVCTQGNGQERHGGGVPPQTGQPIAVE